MTRYVIPHKLPSSEEMRAETKRKVDAPAGQEAPGSERLGVSHVPKVKGNVFANGTIMTDAQKRGQYRPVGQVSTFRVGGAKPMKHRDDRGCSGMCLLGLSGKCVACSEDDLT